MEQSCSWHYDAHFVDDAVPIRTPHAHLELPALLAASRRRPPPSCGACEAGHVDILTVITYAPECDTNAMRQRPRSGAEKGEAHTTASSDGGA